jgi:predicted ATPase
MAIASDQGFSFWLAGGTVLRGWALAAENDVTGVNLIREGLAAWQAAGSVTYRSYFLALLAEAVAAHGRRDEALDLTDEALAVVERTHEGLCEAEIHRLRGELLLQEDQGEAEACFRRALDIAHRQGALSLELRAAMSLHRLGGDRFPQRLLAEVYGRFTEGFDTPDLVDARTLLREPRHA